MNVIYLLGLIKQGIHFFEWANSNHIASIYIETNVTLLCMHIMDIFPTYCTYSKTLSSHSQRKWMKQHVQRSLKWNAVYWSLLWRCISLKWNNLSHTWSLYNRWSEILAMVYVCALCLPIKDTRFCSKFSYHSTHPTPFYLARDFSKFPLKRANLVMRQQAF